METKEKLNYLKVMTDEIFECYCSEYGYNCKGCPFDEIIDHEHICIVEQFGDRLDTCMQKENGCNFRNANNKYLVSNHGREILKNEFKIKRFKGICGNCKNNEECFVKMSTIKECAFFNKV